MQIGSTWAARFSLLLLILGHWCYCQPHDQYPNFKANQRFPNYNHQNTPTSPANSLKSEDENVHRGTTESGNQVAFSAYKTRNQDGTIRQASVVVFEQMTINVGNSFEPQTGIFICRIPGLYMITFTAAANIGRKLNIDLIKLSATGAETVLGGLLKTKSSSKHIEVYSRTILVHLVIGDQLYIRQAAGIVNGLYSDWEKQTSYAGFLVYPDSNPQTMTKPNNPLSGSNIFDSNATQKESILDHQGQNQFTLAPSKPNMEASERMNTKSKLKNTNEMNQFSKDLNMKPPNAETMKTWFKYLYNGLKKVGDNIVEEENSASNLNENWDSRQKQGAQTQNRHKHSVDHSAEL